MTASGGGTYLLVDWRYPPGIAPSYFPLLFQLRYRELGSSVWVVSPLSFPARTPSRRNTHRPIRAKVLGSCDRLGGKSGWRSSSLKHQTPEKTTLRSSKAAPGASPQTALAIAPGPVGIKLTIKAHLRRGCRFEPGEWIRGTQPASFLAFLGKGKNNAKSQSRMGAGLPG